MTDIFLGLVTAAALAAAASQSDTADILDEAYSKSGAEIDLCGISAPTFSEFEEALLRDAYFHEENSNSEYRVFVATTPEFRQLVIARPRETAFPMAYCRTLMSNTDGSTSLRRNMHCQGDKADCDEVFMEFYRHDEAILRSIER